MTADTLSKIISDFGRGAASKLSNLAISGSPEDQLRGPLERLVEDGLASLTGFAARKVKLVGETGLSDIKTRPDYAVTVDGASLVGFIEVKAPGKGADPRKFSDPHDRNQWSKLKSLPNLLYTDGNAFSLWRDGELQGKILHLEGDIKTSGSKLSAPDVIVTLFHDFLSWNPIPPKTPRKLAEISARMCRLLRDEVTEQLELNSSGLTGLAEDWRKLLFPQADNQQFSDGYAQAVTFGLLIARTRNIPLTHGIDQAASELKKTNSLIGTALSLLTDNPDNTATLKTSLGTMARVFNEVNWPDISKDEPEAWLYFYEHFLEVYDNTLRKRTGSYYTPPEVVNTMVRMVDELLRGPMFSCSHGFATEKVTVADPAVGTGTFLLGILRRIAETVEDDLGKGAVPAAIADAAKRLIGFEIQFGPFAVAQLRLIAEFQELMKLTDDNARSLPELKLFITDTLANPFVDDDWLPQVMLPVAKSRKDANTIKKGQPITVVIGNPPYKDKAEGLGAWVEQGAGGDVPALMEHWRPPLQWGVSAHTKHLKNLYVYFWRWATWKVFGSGHYAATGLQEKDEEGIVCFITVAGFLNGPGFQRMREDLRQTCSDIWVIDCSAEGHQPEVATRIFQGVQQPVCIVIAARKKGKSKAIPARVHFTALPRGRREEKFRALAKLSLTMPSGWLATQTGWRDPFLPAATGQWADFPALKDLFIYNGSGVMPGRTWVIAPDRDTLEKRWTRLIREKDPVKQEEMFHPHQNGDKTVAKRPQTGLAGHENRTMPVKDDIMRPVAPIPYGFRSFDRSWIIPDSRLINRPNPNLWNSHSDAQVFLTALERASPNSGPAVTLTGLIPDLDHYKGSFGGRVYPLFRDASASRSNFKQHILSTLAENLGVNVTGEDMMAYCAAVMAHPAFTATFKSDLVQPGLRLPVTADAALFAEAVELGRTIVWLHCYGERYFDEDRGRHHAHPRMPKGKGPTIPAEGAIPGALEPLPETISYDAPTRRLTVGKGYIDNVSPEVWNYEVSGKQVVLQWFSYRRLDRTRPVIGDRRPPSSLEAIQPDHWPAEYTNDLLNMLHVLGRLVALEPEQASLLERILESPVITIADFGLPEDNAQEIETGNQDA